MKRSLLGALLTASLATGVQAHIAVTPNEGKPGSQTMIKIHVSHGCEGKPTTAVRIDIPREITMAHPMAVDGWTFATTHSGARTTSVTWQANATSETTPDFEVHIGLPGSERTLYLPVTQTCGAAVVHWNQKPSGAAKALEHPAPTIKVTLYPSGGPVLHLH